MNRKEAKKILTNHKSLCKLRKKIIDRRWKTSICSPEWVRMGERIESISAEISAMEPDKIAAFKVYIGVEHEVSNQKY